MQEELALLVDQLDSASETSFGQFTYYTGKLCGVDVALFLCGIGKVNAAVGTTLLLDKFKPDYLINTGVAGGLPDEINIGDIVISSEVRHHDADATAFEYEVGQIPKMPVSYVANEQLLNLASKARPCCDDVCIHQGPILSGDSFVHTKEQISRIVDRFTDVMAVEMEGAAIAQTGFLFNVPFILIRSISDKVHQESSTAVYEKCMEKAAANSISMLISMLENVEDLYLPRKVYGGEI